MLTKYQKIQDNESVFYEMNKKTENSIPDGTIVKKMNNIYNFCLFIVLCFVENPCLCCCTLCVYSGIIYFFPFS